ncbi:MAG: hypothetical protein IT356_05905 [Gemmatimonadaceae bacterium]|nr:hypothetical protein [Gemmatimonadaceae bacterium]
MPSSRTLTAVFAALTVTAFATAPAAAQGDAIWDVRPSSWYWGIYGGQTSFPTTVARTTAPTVGVEWTITRSEFALNVFAEQSYFNAVTTIPDYPTSAPRRVDIQDMRRVGASAMTFLPQYKYFHPWFGLGYAFNFIKQAIPEGSAYASPAARDSVSARIESGRAQGKMFAEAGMMVSYREWAPFAQYTVMPTKGSSSWMVNGDGFTNVWKLGLRYSFGHATQDRW